jgi:hypothetical protein
MPLPPVPPSVYRPPPPPRPPRPPMVRTSPAPATEPSTALLRATPAPRPVRSRHRQRGGWRRTVDALAFLVLYPACFLVGLYLLTVLGGTR